MKKIFAAAGLLVLVNAAAYAQAQPFRVDHFKCYFPSEASLDPASPIQLLDQFGPANTYTFGLFRLCNPTRKFHDGKVTPIQNPDDHLALKPTGPQPLVVRRVKIRNQFGDQQIITRDARVLAVPTQKKPHGPPRELNHFSCYVSDGDPVNADVGLQDQFFGSKHRIGRPVLFCNPVQKWHNGVMTPITNPTDHLTCYAMTPRKYERGVEIRNQFGEQKLKTSYTDISCVPTQKLAWEIIDY
jgi:hypothetical protein